MLAPCYSVIMWYVIYDWIQINTCGLGGKGQYYVGVGRVGECGLRVVWME